MKIVTLERSSFWVCLTIFGHALRLFFLLRRAIRLEAGAFHRDNPEPRLRSLLGRAAAVSVFARRSLGRWFSFPISEPRIARMIRRLRSAPGLFAGVMRLLTSMHSLV